jgi:hypothetical protein
MKSIFRFLVAPCVAAVFLGACSLSTDLQKNISANYSVYSVNGNSPDAQTLYGIGGNKVSIPRGTLLLNKDGTVEEVLQYVITRPAADPIAATDTVFGHYELVDGRYDIRLPSSLGAEGYAGSTNLETDFVSLARSWKKNGVVVDVTISYVRHLPSA